MTKSKKPELEKIRQLRLRYGFRLKSIFWPLDTQEVGQILDKLGYKNIEIDPNGGVRASKPNVDFYSERLKMVFGFHANTIDGLISAQKEFFASAQKNSNISLHNFIRFSEIENAISYRLERPDNRVSGIFTDSVDMEKISGIIENNVVLSKLEVGKANASIQDDDWFTVEISPKAESGGNEYYCRMVKRSKNNDDVLKTLRKSHKILEELAEFTSKKQS